MLTQSNIDTNDNNTMNINDDDFIITDFWITKLLLLCCGVFGDIMISIVTINFTTGV